MTEIPSHGGKREGAGRPFVPVDEKKVPLSVSIPQWMVDKMESMPESRSKIVENALIVAFNQNN